MHSQKHCPVCKMYQPGKVINSFIRGYKHSIEYNKVSFDTASGLHHHFYHGYNAGRVEGHKEVKLTNLLKGQT